MKSIIHQKKKYLRQQNAKFGLEFRPYSAEDLALAHACVQVKPIAAWRNRDFVVSLFDEAKPFLRLTVARTMINGGGDYLDGITWDQLQDIKSCVGYGEHCAVEVFPEAKNLINVASLRHLWIYPLGERPPFAWVDGRRGKSGVVAASLLGLVTPEPKPNL